MEDLEIEPFEISFDTWVIVPHMEALQAEWRNAETVPSVENVNQYTNQYEEEDQKVRELIAREEKLGQEKSRARQIKREQEGAIPKSPPYTAPPVKEKETKSPSEVLEEQKLQYEEFGGPCILCLEPDQETKEKLCEIREALAEILDHDTYSSPSSVYSWNFVQDFETDYRPLIPISSFESIQSALDVARRLKGLWGDPLSWEVKDLHLISCRDDGEEDWEASSSPQSMMEWNKEPWALNARIMLMGEEIEQDKHFNEQIVMKLVEEGEAGGLDISMDFTVLDDDEEELSAIEQYLDDDEDWDEGTQVVIGRTHFYTGDQGTYRGMPASSVVDAKDRSLGEGGVVSGLARRRRTSSRQGSLWAEGEFGRRGSDYLPWNKREKPKKLANLEGLSDSFSGMYGIDDDNEDDNEDDGGDNDNEDDNDGGGDNDNEDGDGDEKLIT